MADFWRGVMRLLAIEGEHSDHPADSGGDTWYGLSRRWHPNLEPWPPTLEEAVDIWRREYWDTLDLDDCRSQVVADRLLDLLAQRSPANVTRMLQKALSADEGVDLAVDGKFGQKTRAALANARPERLERRLRALQAAHYVTQVDEHPDQVVFLDGWLRRVFGDS